jgi:hypothetical protein
MKLTNTAIFVFIMLVATVLRVYDLTGIPFTYDEFSALYRTRFDSFSDLIKNGVMVDTLPAGIQVFLFFWTKLFGFKEWIVKMPFIISGILSVLLIYLVAKIWFNETVALISAAFLASLQYTVIYSQIARPYSSGLFLSLLMVFFWSKLVKTPDRRFSFNALMFSLTAAGCAYNHHFSLLFAAIVGLSGLFKMPKSLLLKYLAFCLLACILYLPHVTIILAQMQLKGNEVWLNSINNDFIIKYILYVFQYSVANYILVLLLIASGFLNRNTNKSALNNYLLFACWFFIPFLIGFLYSRLVNNVMQFSVLIFCFPFLLFLLFGHIKQQKTIINLGIVCIILIVNIYSLVVIRQHYTVFYKSQYLHMLTDRNEASKLHPGIPAIIDSDKWISGFYAEKYGLDTNFTWFNTIKDEKALSRYLDDISHNSEFLYFGCLSSNPPNIIPVIHDFFPSTEVQHNYAGATTYIFSKEGDRRDRIIENYDFNNKPGKYWSGIKSEQFYHDAGFPAESAYVIDKQAVWSPIYERKFDDELNPGMNDFIDISVKVCCLDSLKEVMLFASLVRGDKGIHWGSTRFDNYLSSDSDSGKWITVHHSIKLSDIDLPHDDIALRAGIWNKGGATFLVDDFIILLRKGNPIIYGLVENIEN